MARPKPQADLAQLDLFDSGLVVDALPPTAAGATPRTGVPAPHDHRAAMQQPAGGDECSAPPFALRHPRAQREVVLGAHRVGYELRRSRRRSIGFAVGTEGLSVAAPRWVGQGEIDAALREKAGWILRKLAEQRDRASRLQAARVDWRDGATIPFLGAPVTVVLDARAGKRSAGAVLDAAEAAPDGAQRLTLRLGLPPDATPQQIRDSVQSWLQRQARRIFEERCRHFAPRLGVQWRRLALSSAQTRWGSASADGSLRLNWRLVHFGMATIDYVVAHELAHLRHMDHSPRFWDVVRSVVPDLDHARRELRTEVLPQM